LVCVNEGGAALRKKAANMTDRRARFLAKTLQLKRGKGWKAGGVLGMLPGFLSALSQ
jgi:hypothetical protein